MRLRSLIASFSSSAFPCKISVCQVSSWSVSSPSLVPGTFSVLCGHRCPPQAKGRQAVHSPLRAPPYNSQVSNVKTGLACSGRHDSSTDSGRNNPSVFSHGLQAASSRSRFLRRLCIRISSWPLALTCRAVFSPCLSIVFPACLGPKSLF